jgi:ssDNA thymidine ADP-ribosyltransferase, DarT
MLAVPGRPIPTTVYHMTRVEHVESIVRSGLLSDNQARNGSMTVEIGNQEIKGRRRLRSVDIDPGGVVADYVPFYFNPRSPMQSSISFGNVPTYTEGNNRLVFLVSSTQRLRELGLTVLVSDRNAALEVAQFTDSDDIDDFVVWEVIRTRYWRDFIQGSELRQAECLVHQRVPWSAFHGIGVKSSEVAAEAEAALRAAGAPGPAPTVRRDWYF